MLGRAGDSCVGKKEKAHCEDAEPFSSTECARKNWRILAFLHVVPLMVLRDAVESSGVGGLLVSVGHSGFTSRLFPDLVLLPSS